MIVTKWRPLRELDLMEQRMRRFFEDASFTPTLLPAADIFETKDEFVLELEVPGFAESQLGIEVTDHTLVVKGERTETAEETDKQFLLRERLDRSFERRFQLPHEADTEHVDAKFQTGVLVVRSPKTKEAEPRKIAIAR